MKKAVKLVVDGTVQGVFFRQFVKDSADKFGLFGFVRNLEDGNVEVVLEGDGDKITQIIEIIKKGPEHSQIRNVSVEEQKFSGEFKEFKVLRI